MGKIIIEATGSFLKQPADAGTIRRVISAEEHGHADAIAQAIEYLAGELLPEAIALDHRIQDDGGKPRNGFQRKEVEGG